MQQVQASMQLSGFLHDVKENVLSRTTPVIGFIGAKMAEISV